jgi:hypothetical protein
VIAVLAGVELGGVAGLFLAVPVVVIRGDAGRVPSADQCLAAECCAIERLQAVADALNLRVNEVFTLERSEQIAARAVQL